MSDRSRDRARAIREARHRFPDLKRLTADGRFAIRGGGPKISRHIPTIQYVVTELATGLTKGSYYTLREAEDVIARWDVAS